MIYSVVYVVCFLVVFTGSISHEMHVKAVLRERSELNVLDASKIVTLESFWQEHGARLGISPLTEMKLLHKKSSSHGVGQSSLTFAQVVDGVQVFGGEFRMTTGAHGGVLNAHGLPFRLADIRQNHASRQRQQHKTQKAQQQQQQQHQKQEAIKARPVNDALLQSLYRAAEVHLYLNLGVRVAVQGLARDPAAGDAARPVELVWYSPGVARGQVQGGSWALTYALRGVHLSANDSSLGAASSASTASPTISAFTLDHGKATARARGAVQAMVCDFFVDAETLHVTDFMDKSSRYSSPFTSPLERAVEVTDYSTQAVVFGSSSTFPTANEERDVLITTTLYVANLMNSLSGGEYLTWARADVTLNIESDLDIANAYFDGDWGIHFGTGYIVDDVIAHEWGHGYMETATASLYQYQPGAMNEAFADILGESVDILNGDTADSNPLRTSTSPTPPCTSEHGGSDAGNRWSMGEDVQGGSIRDMYSPRCHYDPDSTYSSYYYCGSADSGGVHWNSGVVNRLYAVLVDGGVYAQVPGAGTGQVLVSPIGMTKALNLFWGAYQELTPTGQFFDLAVALKQTCALLTGQDIYEPNLLSTALTVSADRISPADCIEVDKAIAQSGMEETSVCPAEDLVRGTCSASAAPADSITHEPFSKYLADYYYVLFGCGNVVGGVTYRAFDYATLGLASSSSPLAFTLECIEFAYLLESESATFTLRVFVDSSGGAPDFSSMTQVGSDMPGAVAFNEENTEVVTVTPAQPFTVTLPSASASVVVALTIDSGPSEGYFWGRGQYNPAAIGTPKETFLSGPCYGGGNYINTASFFNAAFGTTSLDDYQWYVQLTKSEPAATAAPSAHPTPATLPSPPSALASAFQPQVVEFGTFTSLAARRNKDEWMPSSAAHVCLEGVANIKKFNVLSLKSIIQSPGADMMNLVVDIQHLKLTFRRDLAFLRLAVLRRPAAPEGGGEEVFQAEQNLFDESALLTHYLPALDAATGHVNQLLKVGLQLNFTAAGIAPLDCSYEAEISIGVRGDASDTDPSDFRVYDCVNVQSSGVLGFD